MILRTLLLVDAEPDVQRTLCETLYSWRIVCADRCGVAAAIGIHRPPVVAVSSPDGLAVLDAILTQAPATKVVLLGGCDERSLAVQAIARGAYDVVRGAADLRDVAVVIERAYQRLDLELECRRLKGDALPPLRAVRDEAERRAVLEALARAGGNLSAAARLLAVSRPTLYNLLRQHGIRTA